MLYRKYLILVLEQVIADNGFGVSESTLTNLDRSMGNVTKLFGTATWSGN